VKGNSHRWAWSYSSVVEGDKHAPVAYGASDVLGFQTLAVTWEATGGGVNNFASHSTEMAVMESDVGQRTRCFGVRIDKTQGEYKESASFSIADMIADIDF
jgi:hypothetical protein